MLKESTYPLLPHIRLQACGIGLAQVDQDWRRLRGAPGRPVSESGRLCHGDEGHEWSARRPVSVDVAYSPVHNYSLLSRHPLPLEPQLNA